ncbi:ShlB/FhaC/HecB family hemolysin secretion/activation protein [Brevundimonas sp. NPDC092305]|uniref:ShlB/FhaC/HecB family hemolysin secretion/activation protein n=1 Tax=Brevundimonas sp. NPDC092305 TaxID=3363957 RepID=UPI00380A6E6F
MLKSTASYSKLLLLGAAVTISICGASASSVAAQDVSEDCIGDCFVLTGLTIQGVTAYPLADLAPLYQDDLARRVSVDDLVRIATAVTHKYRSDGYFLTRAVVAPHNGRSGAATLVVYEGFVDQISVDGAGADAVRSVLQPLANRRPLTIDEFDRRLALASDFPGVTLKSRLEPVLGDPARHNLVVETDLDRASAGAYLENRGSDAQGPWQAYLTASLNTVITPGDQLTFSTLTTPEQPDELTSAEWAYSTPLGEGRRLRFAVSGYSTDAPPGATNSWLSGRSHAFSANYAQPLMRSRRKNLWLNAGLDVRHVEQTFVLTGLNDEDLTVARVSLAGQYRMDEGYVSGSLQVSQGLDAFGATVENAPTLTRNDADAVFTKVNLNLWGYHDLGRYVGVYGEMAAQWSGDPLLNSEEFFVGGPTFGRAYNYGEVGGDRAVAAMVEMRLGWDPEPRLVEFLQVFAFYDAASVSNYDFGGGMRSDELSTAGAGVRVTLAGQVVVKLELAKPLDWIPYTETDNGWRTFVSLSKQF